MADPAPLTDTVFVSRFNRVLAIAIWVVAAALTITVLIGGGPNRALAFIPAAFVCLFAWTALWRPYVRVGEDNILVRNVLSTVTVPWSALIHVDTRYALTLYTPGHKFSAWAAPAPGRTGTAMARRAEKHGRVDAPPAGEGRVRPGDLLGSESGQAAYIVREKWNELQSAGTIESGIADQVRVPLRVHWSIDLSLIALAVAAVFALIAL